MTILTIVQKYVTKKKLFPSSLVCLKTFNIVMATNRKKYSSLINDIQGCNLKVFKSQFCQL